MNFYDKEKSPDYLKGIFETTSMGIFVVDANGHVLRSNSTFDRLLGYEKDELKGKLFTEIAHKNAKVQKITSQIKLHHFQRSSEFPLEMELRDKEGNATPVRLLSFLIKDEKGKVVEAVGMVEDLRKDKGEEALQQKVWETQETLHNVLANSGDAILVADANGRITIANEALLQMLGYQEDEISGRHLVELSPYEGNFTTITGEELTLTEEYINFQVEKANELFERGKVSNYELYFIRKDGKIVPVEATISLLKDQKGERSGSIAILRDITERKKAEREIKEARDFLKNVIESSKDGIFITDVSGNIISINSAMENMCKFSREELMGKHTSMLPIEDKDIRKSILEKMSELFEKGFTIYETIHETKEGNYINVECSTSMIKNEKGEYIAGVSIIRDITQRKKMEQRLLQSEKLKSLGELAGGVAHDFNNVLAAILGRAQLLKMSVEPPQGEQERRKMVYELKKGLEIIEKAAKDGAETVRRIQEFSRRRDEDKYFTTIDLNEIIDNVLEFTKVRWKDDAESKGIKINIQKEFSSLPSTSGSAAELREVFINIINNAIDAMPQGGNIKIKTFKEESHISIKVKDTGIGIANNRKDRIFDPFFTTKGVQSSGLGMSVSYGIINRHRGTITVDSIEGKGTTFIIKLPISEKVIETEQVKPIPEEQRKARILIIEDEENVRDILSAILIKGGHEVEATSDGSKGIKLFKKKEFNLVFTDLGMPSMSGWQVAEEVKGINKSVPVALITGWNVELNESEMRKSGVDLLVYKPFELNQVLRLVQEGMILRDRFKAA